jgi:hypothetical protein
MNLEKISLFFFIFYFVLCEKAPERKRMCSKKLHFRTTRTLMEDNDVTLVEGGNEHDYDQVWARCGWRR